MNPINGTIDFIANELSEKYPEKEVDVTFFDKINGDYRRKAFRTLRPL